MEIRRTWQTLGATACALVTVASLGGCQEKAVPQAPAPESSIELSDAEPRLPPDPTRGGDEVPTVAPRPDPEVVTTEATLLPETPAPSDSTDSTGPTEPTGPTPDSSE